MPRITCEVSRSLLDALEARRKRTGESVDHIVTNALADALQVDHSTLFQVSTAGSLVEGVTQGVVTVRELLRHGDFGLGTFAELDGELVVVDGVAHQVTHEGVRRAADDAQVPFAVVTAFAPEGSCAIEEVDSFDDLASRLDALRDTDNDFFAVRIEGRFDAVRTRVVCRSRQSRRWGPSSIWRHRSDGTRQACVGGEELREIQLGLSVRHRSRVDPLRRLTSGFSRPADPVAQRVWATVPPSRAAPPPAARRRRQLGAQSVWQQRHGR